MPDPIAHDLGNLPARMAEVIGSHEWTEFPRSAHNQHNYYTECAVCQRDIPRMTEVALGVRDELVAHLSARAAVAEAKVEHAEAGAELSSERLAEVRQELAEARAEGEQFRQHILDIDAHATPYEDLPDDPGYVGLYLLTSGALHRALGKVGHTAVPCQDARKVTELQEKLEQAERDLTEAKQWHDTYQSEVNARDEFFGDLLELLPGAEDEGMDAYDQIPRGIKALRAERDALNAAVQHLAAEAHRRKWVHEGHPAFSDFHRLGNDLLAALTAPVEGTTTPARENV